MTSPYSSSLLHESVDTTVPRPGARPPVHTRSVTNVVAQPAPVVHAPQYAPQPQVVYAAPPARSGGAVAAIALGLVVVLLGAVALVGAYYATRQASPSEREAVLAQRIAMGEGVRAGRARGIDAGRQDALSFATSTSAYRVAAARERAFSTAYARGERAGRSSYRPRSYGYGGYRAPRYRGGYTGGDLVGAFGAAQGLANMTGAPVDIEVY